jgi:hypothetical protein
MARPTDHQRTEREEVDVTDRATARPDGADARRDDIVTTERRAEAVGAEPAVRAEGNGAAIASLVVGMLAATFAFYAVSVVAAVIAGIVAVGLGIRGLGLANRLGGLHKGLAVSGIVSGTLGLLLGIAIIAGGVTIFQNLDTGDIPAELRQPIQDVTG